jgi:SAM-dependent methyltransferase
MNEDEVARHYHRGDIEERILAALEEHGIDTARLGFEDLGAVDEFHIGAREATEALARQMDLRAGSHLLDIGSGIGGPARYFAACHGCRVSGVDLTAAFVEAASALTGRCGLSDVINFHQASALDLPFEEARFDGAYLLHVGMNIADKARLFAEAHRVLKAGAKLAVYEVMQVGAGEITFPVPWATTAATSFVAAPEDYRAALAAAGFTLLVERDRGDFALAYFRKKKAEIAAKGPPVLGNHLLMGADAPTKIANMLANVEAGTLAPVEMILQRR